MQRAEWASANEIADSALHRFRKRSPEWAARFLILKAEILVRQGESKQALTILAAPLPSSLAHDDVNVRRLIALGVANSRLQHSAEALTLLDEAQRIGIDKPPQLRAEVAINRGTFFASQYEFAKARAEYHKSLSWAEAANNDYLRSNALGGLGFASMQQARYDEAIDWFNESLAIATRIQNQVLQAVTLGNLGWCYYRLGDLDRAKELLQQGALAFASRGMLVQQGRLLNDLGLVSVDQGELTDSANYLERALSISRQIENQETTVNALGNLADVAFQNGHLDLAAKYASESLSLGRKTGDDMSQLEALSTIAEIDAAQKKYQKSETALMQVIRSAREPWLRWRALSELGKVYALEARSADADREFQGGLVAIDEARAALNVEEHRLSFLTSASRFYNSYIDFLVEHGRVKDALRIAEHSRARTLAEGLGINLGTTPAPGRVSRPLKAAQTDPVRDSGSLKAGQEDPVRDSGRLKVAQDEILGHSEQNESSPRNRTIDSALPFDSAFSPERISQHTNAIILEYWLKPEHSYLWAVTPNNVALFKLPADTEINAAVQDYRKALLGPRDPLDTGNTSGRKLYDMLVAPAHNLIRPGARVIVIADGGLNNLNFETLIAPAPKPHYWIEDVTLSDASSLALLAGSRHATAPRLRNLLLVGDPVSASPEYPRLPQGATEIDRVEQHFPAKARLVLAGAQATPQAYLASDTGRFSYVHFVAHGTASRTTPLESAVILSPQGDSYKLYARDIVTKPLHADLVTISTCYGAGSRAYTGEGLVGLSWAFLRAGAHNTIAALWEVNDASTAQLMDQLYAGIDKGKDPAAALRAAKLAMLHSDGVYRRPFYWAPFQLYQGSSGAEPQVPAPHSVR